MNPPKHAITTVTGLALLCVAAVFYARRVPSTVPDSAPATTFSASRAMRHVNAIAERPHAAGSEASAAVRLDILGELLVLGFEPRVQSTTGIGTRYAVVGRVHNILARLPGKRPGGPAVLLMAHYDGVLAGPAAGDDAAGCAVLLETLRALKSGAPLEHDVVALFTDAEEAGLLGAAAFVREDPWAKDVEVVMNFEARGTRGPSLMFETGAGNLDIVRVLRGAGGSRATSLSTTVYRKLPNDTDLSELALLARPALNFAFIGGADRYHTSQDDVRHLDQRSLQHHGNQALALARAFGNGPLPRPTTTDAVFFDAPLIGLVVYPETWALPIAVLAGILVVAAIVRSRQRQAWTIGGLALGFGGALLSLLVAAAAGAAVANALARFHAAIRSGTPEWSSIYVLAVTMLSFAIAMACYALVRRWASAAAARYGALLFVALIALWVTIVAPGASFVLSWPLIVIAATALAESAMQRRLLDQAALWVGTTLVVFLVVPVAYLMAAVALGLVATGAAVLGVFTALAAWLLPSHLESMLGDRAVRATVIAFGLAVTLFAVGMVAVRTDVNHPAGASVVYAVDPDSGGAWLTGYGMTSAAQSALRASLRDVKSSGVPAPPWLRRVFDTRSIVPAPVTPFEPGIVRIVGDSVNGGDRRITLHIRPLSHARSVLMMADTGVVQRAEVDGRAVDPSRYRSRPRSWRLQYVAPPDSGFTLTLTVRGDAHPMLAFIHRLEGLPPLRGIRLPPRPPGFIPGQDGDMTWVYYRLQL